MFKLYGSDEEQINALKDWWTRNGRQTLIVTFVIIISYVGYSVWDNAQQHKHQQAAIQFAKWHPSQALSPLIKPPYRDIAQWQRSMYLIQHKKYQNAAQHLTALSSKNTSLGYLARYQLASLYQQQGQHQKALHTFSTLKKTSFSPLALEGMGDAYYRLNKTTQAKAAYTQALKQLDARKSQVWATKKANITFKLHHLSS